MTETQTAPIAGFPQQKGGGTLSRRQISAARVRENILDAMGELVRDLLSRPDTTDIILNPDGKLWLARLGHVREHVGYMTPEAAERLIGAVASSMGRAVTEDAPRVSGHLIIGGERFEGAIPPIVQAPFFAIRKHASSVFLLDDYVASGALTPRQKEIIEDDIRERRNIIIAGGTGSGKTTFLNAVIAAITDVHPHHRFFIIEDTLELKCSAPDNTSTLTSDMVDMNVLAKMAMRSFSDRIIVGEVRDGAFLTILNVWNTGHEGGAATVHSNVRKQGDALKSIELKVMMATELPMQRLIAETVNTIVYLDRIDGRHKVTSIVSVDGWDGRNYELHAKE